jgi:hypothetical protein
MSMRTYYMDDCTIPIPSGFQDGTVNTLEWSMEGGDRIALLVQRDRLPRATPDDDTGTDALDRYVDRQTRGYPARFTGFHLERDDAAISEGGLAMRRKVFRWRHEQGVLYHHQIFVAVGDTVVVLTGSAKARHREAVDGLIGEAIGGLRIREEGA